MHVEIEKKDNSINHMTITISSKIIDTKIYDKLKQLKQTQKMNGFRNGKIPFSIIKKKYLTIVKNDIINDIMNTTFYEIIQKRNIKILGKPKYKLKKYQYNDTLIYVVIFIESPIFDPKYQIKKSLKNLSIITSNTDIEKIIHNMKKKEQEQWITISREIRYQDLVNINYVLLTNNTNLHQYNKKNYQFIIGNHHLLKHVENNILNKKTGDIIILDIQFPIYHFETQLQGKKIQCQIEIKNVKEKNKKICLTNDQNTHYINKNHTTYTKLFNKIKYQTYIDSQKITKKYLEQQILNILLEQNKINIPSIYLDEKITKIKYQRNKKYQLEQTSILISIQNDQELRDEIKKQTIIELLFTQIQEDNNLKINEKTIQSIHNNLLLNMPNKKQIQKLYSDKNFVKKLINVALNETIFQFLLKNIKLIPIQCNLHESTKYYN
ncbi:MAG: trigger factor [Buchnera aphidicola (Eriosoma harunire)]